MNNQSYSTWCPSRRLECANSENSKRTCAGPVHLTSEWDIGSRQCCNGAGKKYSSAHGLLKFCSTNGGKERLDSVEIIQKPTKNTYYEEYAPVGSHMGIY